MGVQEKYDRLNKAEKDFLFWHPFAAVSFNGNASTALKEAQKRFGPTTLHNNGVGFDIGSRYFGSSDRQLAVLCVQAWANKKLVQIDVPNGSDLIYSNSYETALYEP